jgi:hypothetical protein
MLPELDELRRLVDEAGDLVRVRSVGEVQLESGERLPLIGLVIGSDDCTLPTFGLFGGVHGLERIGTQTVLSYLTTLLRSMQWDRGARARFESCRLVSIPIVNPGGMALHRRSNPRGVDLMRNAPIDAGRTPFLVGGHRFTPRLPWYRGRLEEPMELEARALVDFVRDEIFAAPIALSLDVHSGFGTTDRLWFPYAKSKGTFPRTAEAQRIGDLLTRTLPYHVYAIEPQSLSYVAHGDLWDYLFDLHWEIHGKNGATFIPWTLEMGSWIWLRKNPRQILARYGPFHPLLPHRLERVLRRHLLLIDFLLRAVDNAAAWR